LCTGNLEAVARSLRNAYPNADLILCADDDYATPGNPGLTKSTAAAEAVGGRLAVPHFGGDRPEGSKDFNDMARHRGQNAVKEVVRAARPVKRRLDAYLIDLDDVTALDEPLPHVVDKWIPKDEVTLL